MDSSLVTLIAAEMLFVAFIIWLVVHYRGRGRSRRTEERMRVLERFESADELTRFLGHPEGRRLFADLQSQSDHPWAWVRIFALYVGFLGILGGLGFSVLAYLEVWNDRDFFLVPAVLCSAFGLGLLIGDIVVGRRLEASPTAGAPTVIDHDTDD